MSVVLVIGIGDLGLRIAERLVESGLVERLIIAGRSRPRGFAHAALLEAASYAAVRFQPLDATSPLACENLLRSERPALVIQAASYVSPWTVASLESPSAQRLRGEGFGLQLPFQVPCLHALMVAVREVGFDGPVVNCSFPDATHALLAANGLAPTVGIGNVAMMQARIESLLRLRGEPGLVRLIAHHSQTVSVMTGHRLAPDLAPRVFVGEAGAERKELTYEGPGFSWSIATNLLSAAVAVRAIRSLLPDGEPVRLSSPGPHGLPGGYPVRLAPGSVSLDLPPDVSLRQAIEANRRFGTLDGIASIEGGVATWTDQAADVLRSIEPGLAEPLTVTNAVSRARRLSRLLGCEPFTLDTAP